MKTDTDKLDVLMWLFAHLNLGELIRLKKLAKDIIQNRNDKTNNDETSL